MTPADMHALVVGQMIQAGHPDARTATYAPPVSGAAVPCVVMFLALSLLDGQSAATIAAQQRNVRLLRAEVPSPARGGIVQLDGAVEQWRLADLLDDGIGSTVWSVTRVRP